MAVNIKQRDDGTTSFHSEQLGKTVLLLGGGEQPVAGGSTVAYHGSSYMKITLGQASLTGGVFSVQNPFSEDVIIGKVLLNLTAGFGTTTANLCMGVGTFSTNFGNNLLDTLTVQTAGVFDNVADKGTSGSSRRIWTSGYYLNCTASITPSTLAGQAFVEILRV